MYLRTRNAVKYALFVATLIGNLHLLHLFNVSAPFLPFNVRFKRLYNIYFSFLSRFLKFCSSEVNNLLYIYIYIYIYI